MNWSAGKIGTINQRSAQANGLSTPPIGCVLHLPGLPGGGSKIYDRSPYGNIGTITGAVWKRLPSGLCVLGFDGEDDYVDCGAGVSLDLTDMTLMAWIKADNVTGEHHISHKGGSGSARVNYRFEVVDGYLRLNMLDAGGWHANTDTAISLSTDTWYLATVTYDGSNVRFYVDAVEGDAPAETTTPPTATESLTIGAYSWGGYTMEWDGFIGLVRIYNRALNALEIQNHFNREKHLFGVW